jgi:hypothetical protein
MRIGNVHEHLLDKWLKKSIDYNKKQAGVCSPGMLLISSTRHNLLAQPKIEWHSLRSECVCNKLNLDNIGLLFIGFGGWKWSRDPDDPHFPSFWK